MRYSIVSKGLSLAQMEAEALKSGAKNLRKEKLLNQVFCELSEAQARQLSQIPGLKVKPVKELRAAQIMAPEVGILLREGQAVTSLQAISIWDIFQELRSLFAPPLSGAGLTVAVLDSGIRKTHQALSGKVVHEANFTDSPGAGDVFGHGTQVAFVAAGCDPGGKAGVAPAAKLMNIKVLNDEGVGTDETVVDGIEEACELVEAGMRNGTHPTEDMFPNVINLSLGSEDDGDPDNPVRVACREAIENYGLDVVSAVGNQGPKMTTIMLPACDDLVIAVGALKSGEIVVWDKSSRGPTLEGATKPDFCFWGTDLEMAGSKADDEYVTKSGTSFSCPMVSGLTGLLWEVVRATYGEDALFKWTMAREFAPYYCTKPEDAPVKKDNAYGYGLPAMSAMVSQMAPAPSPMQQTMEVFPMLMIIGMMGMMVRGVV